MGGNFAYYQVFANRIHVEIHNLPDRLLTPDTDNHGKACQLHTVDYTDDTHPTHETYLKGNRSERSFDIPLKRNRQRGSQTGP